MRNDFQNVEEHISVCVCTYKRPGLLKKLLQEVLTQETRGRFSFDVIVVDNDATESAREVVEKTSAGFESVVSYVVEPQQNISLARNRAVRNASGKYAAFIDDDEFPVKKWLLHLHKTICKYEVQGVLGPVKPHFENPPPSWVIRGRLCERASFPSGSIISNSCHTRTGNVLLSLKIFESRDDFFNPDYGRTGGEDVDFFRRMMQKGHRFVWDNEAEVFESVPPERVERKYFLRRALLRGLVSSRKFTVLGTLKSVVAVGVYTLSLPVLLILGHHFFMRYLIKDCDHIGKLLGLCGFRPLTERSF